MARNQSKNKTKTKNNAISKSVKSREQYYARKGINSAADMIQTQNIRNVYSLYSNEFSGLTGTQLHYFLDCARRNLNFFKALLFAEIRRRDLRIGGVCQTRKLSVGNKEWELGYGKDIAGDEKILEHYKYAYEKIGITNLITDITEAQIQGVSTFEINWDIVPGAIMPVKVKYIQNYLLCYDDISDKYKYLNMSALDMNKLRSIAWKTMDARIDLTGIVTELDEMKSLEVHSLDGNENNGFMNGCIDSLIWAYFFKSYGVKDWATFIEKFATPPVVGKVPALISDTDLEMFKEAIRNYGNNFKLVIPEETEISFPTDANKGSSAAMLESYVDYWDTRIAERVLGQSLTTQGSDKGHGSMALGQVHEHVAEDLQLADMKLVTETMNKLNAMIAEVNGWKIYPIFYFKAKENIEYMKSVADIILKLRQAGWRTKKEDVQKNLNMEIEEMPEDTGAGANKYIKEITEEYYTMIKV